MKSIFVISFLAGSFVCFGQNTSVFEATKDTYINQVINDQPQGQIMSNVASAWTYNGVPGYGRSLIGFELCEVPDNFELISAHLYLYFGTGSGHAGHTTDGINSAKLFQVTSPWTENTTWNSQPTYNSLLYAPVPPSTGSSDDYVIDVTNVVATELNTSNLVDFFLILDTQILYHSLVFASRNHTNTSLHPRLEIVYNGDFIDCIEDTTTTVVEPTEPEATLPGNCLGQIVIPNVFTPNGDGVNDQFTIKSTCTPESYHLTILNRWGQLVYQSNDIAFPWTGHTPSGAPVSEGVYFYTLEGTFGTRNISESGFLQLQRK